MGNCYISNKQTTGKRRELHNKELNDLSTSHPIVLGVKKSRRMRCEGHVARMAGEDRCI